MSAAETCYGCDRMPWEM